MIKRQLCPLIGGDDGNELVPIWNMIGGATMPDRETVITHLQIIHTWADFSRERDLQFFTAKHLESIAQWSDDALKLLKEQEEKTVESIQMNRSDKWGADLTGYCPSCKRPLKSRFNQRFCGECGQAVKWE